MKRQLRRGFTLVELMVVIGILGLLVGILAVAVIPKLTEAQNKLELKQVGDLMAGFQNIAADDSRKRKLNHKAIKDTKGEKFYEAAFKHKLLDDSLISKIVSLASNTDSKADRTWLEGDQPMPPNSCSYTAPKGSDLLVVMNLKGTKRKVVLSFNERNWNNYGEAGVLVQWSDNETAVYLTTLEATDDPWNLDEKSWNDNPGEIIGQKSPFDRTFN